MMMMMMMMAVVVVVMMMMMMMMMTMMMTTMMMIKPGNRPAHHEEGAPPAIVQHVLTLDPREPHHHSRLQLGGPRKRARDMVVLVCRLWQRWGRSDLSERPYDLVLHTGEASDWAAFDVVLLVGRLWQRWGGMSCQGDHIT
jgi:hypothetical protein